MVLRFASLILLILPIMVYSQDSTSLYNKVFNLPDKFFNSITSKSERFQQNVIKGTDKYLRKLAKQELKMQRKLAKTDSAAAKEIFGDVEKRYADMRNGLINPSKKLEKLYNGHLDSIGTSLKFLVKSKVLVQSEQMQNKLNGAFKNYDNVQDKLNYTAFLEQQLKERQEFLKNKLQSFPLSKSFSSFKQNVYYYRAQIDEYRQVFEKPEKTQALLLSAVSKVPAFKNFFAKYSALGTVFQLPGNENGDMAALSGMQTRRVLEQELGDRLGSEAAVQGTISDNISTAQSSLQMLKENLADQQSNGNPSMPNFKPNPEKTKSFLKRLEIGTNVQSTKSDYFFPQTTDFGLSVGYKFKPNILAGLGFSYRLGLGKDFRHMAISHQGVGFRSFGETKLKGSLWISGGAELNYRAQFRSFNQLKQYSAWQRSALIGLSKKYRVKKTMADMKLLYDFLHNQHRPATQPLVFRIGYSIK